MTTLITKQCRHAVTTNGFSLVEVLIAVVVVAIGLLGVAKLNMINLQNANSAYFLSVATNLAMEMSERIKANRQGVINLHYHHPTQAAAGACYSAGCAPQQMADTDFFEWRANLAEQLPNGTGNVCIDSMGSNVCDGDSITNEITHAITVNWTDHVEDKTISLPVRVLP